jgi:hypothetical protein
MLTRAIAGRVGRLARAASSRPGYDRFATLRVTSPAPAVYALACLREVLIKRRSLPALRGRVQVALNRPDKRNALNHAAWG